MFGDTYDFIYSLIRGDVKQLEGQSVPAVLNWDLCLLQAFKIHGSKQRGAENDLSGSVALLQ